MSSLRASASSEHAGEKRARIIAAATALFAAGGEEAATTRAIAAAASVQAPTIYRLFGDKEGLLDAVAEQAFADYVEIKSQRRLTDDPVTDLRRDWDAHVAFGLAFPEVFAVMHVNPRTPPSRAWTAGIALLTESVRRVARTGRLLVSEERAVDLLDGGTAGTVLTLSRKAPAERDALCAAAREAIFEAIFAPAGPKHDHNAGRAASTLRASLDEVTGLSPGERALLDELLQGIAEGSS